MTQWSHSWTYTQKKMRNLKKKKYMHPNLHNNTIYNSQDMEAT